KDADGIAADIQKAYDLFPILGERRMFPWAERVGTTPPAPGNGECVSRRDTAPAVHPVGSRTERPAQ
ncbi:hypothetical protein ACWEWX_51585, partial [Streptomyces asiaticus]